VKVKLWNKTINFTYGSLFCKKMKKLLCLILVAGIFGFASCKKKDNSSDNPPNPKGTCRMISYQDSTQINNFYYNAAGRISSIEFIYSSSDTGRNNYYYDNDHVAYMTSSQGWRIDTVRYTWDSGRYTGFTEYGVVYKILYNNLNQIIRIEEYQDSVKMAYSEYTWDSNNNCTLSTDYALSGSQFVANHKSEITFGTNRNFYYSVGMPPVNSLGVGLAMFFSPNNLIKVKFTYPLQGSSTTLVFYYTSFNSYGYPLRYNLTDTLNHYINSASMSYACP
jgi:hypothetical protein